MAIPSDAIPDRSGFLEVAAHGIDAQLSVEASELPPGSVQQLKIRDAAEVAYVSSATVHRGPEGTRVWNITGLPGITYSFHLPVAAAVAGRVPGFERLYLGSAWVEARTLEGDGRFSSVRIYDGSSRISTFGGLSRRQLRRDDVFRLQEIVPITCGLDVEIRLSTPMGSLCAFEIACVGAVLVEDERVVVDTGPATVAASE